MTKVRLSRIVDIISGGTPKTSVPEYWEDGSICWLSVNDFNNGNRYVYTSEKKITELGLKKSNTKMLNRDDIIISARGTVGVIAQIGTPMCFNQSCFGLRGKQGIVDNEFLYYCLKNYVRNIKRRSQGSVFDTINLKSFDLMELEIPENIEDQRNLTAILSLLDKKIELNNRINSELEVMAKTIYDYWFVQFDFPDDNGNPYKSSGGKMDWSEELKRDIPSGWSIGNLLDIANFTNGIACQKYRPINEQRLRVIKIKEMHEGFSDDTEFVRADIPEKIKISNGDILFSWSASLEVMLWTKGYGALNQHIFKVTSKKYPKSYFYFQLKDYLNHFKMMAENRKTTMGHITQEHLIQSRIAIPPVELTKKLNRILANILDEILILEEQNLQLKQLRDWLLPMLMNGQVRVNDKLQ